MARIAIAALALVALVATGCGGSSNSSSTTTTSTTQPPSSSTATPAAGYTLTGQARAAGSTTWKPYPVVTVKCGSAPSLSANPYNLPATKVCAALAAYVAAPTKQCNTPTGATGRVLIAANGSSKTVAVLPPFQSCQLSAALEQRDTVIAAAAFRTSPG